MGLLRRRRAHRREKEAAARSLAEMQRAEGIGTPEPKEVKLSQMRD
jgi:hypothetical protein